jgi:drug/metabolite transporter (DMT)-like permease
VQTAPGFSDGAPVAGARLLGAKVASFVGLTEVLFALVFAWVLLGQSLGTMQLTGSALVIVGIALVRMDELRTPTDGRTRAHPA